MHDTYCMCTYKSKAPKYTATHDIEKPNTDFSDSAKLFLT